MFVKGIPPKMLHEQFGLYHGQWMPEMDRCWEDYERGYSVCSRMLRTKQFGNVEHVTISRHHSEGGPIINTGGTAPIGWNEKMEIKNELFGEDRFAIEVYPKQSKLVDVADVYHLWVFDKKLDMPFGIHPSEHKNAIISRDMSFDMDDMEVLKEHMDLKEGG